MPQVLEKNGAGEGNRTLVISLEGSLGDSFVSSHKKAEESMTT